jgi:hypothetical protein
MCEWYIDICYQPSCIALAKQRAEQDPNKYRDEYYVNRSGTGCFLYKGYSAPCTHIAKGHGPECAVVKRQETEYGLMYDTCNCDPDDEKGWVYY